MNIIRSYQKAEFDKIPRENLIAFLGAGRRSRIQCLDPTNANDMKILRSWEKHFQKVGSPYAIEMKGTVLYLWKERRI